MAWENVLWKRPGRILFAVLGIVLLICGQATAQDGIWTTEAPMPTPRNSLAAGVVDGVLYAIGGESSSGGALATVEAYNPKTNSWTARASMPSPCSKAAAGVIDDIIYVVACPDFLGARATQAYDPKTNTWTARALMPTPRQGLAVAVVDGILYVIGGMQIAFNNTNFDTVEAYDPKANTWTTKSSMPTARCCMAAGVINGLIYVAGGTRSIGHGGIETPATLEVYNPKTDSWNTRAAMPTGRGGVAGAVVAGRLYVIGGILAPLDSELIRATVEVYDPKTDSWTTQFPMPTARTALAAGVVEDTLYAVGGQKRDPRLGDVSAVSVNEAFSPFLAVAIDIKPGDPNNIINLKSAGTVLVVILGSATFDPMTVEPATVTLAGAHVATRGQGQPMTAVADVNQDGFPDLVLHFRTQDLKLSPTDTEAVLRGETFSGQRIRGADSVRIVPGA